MGGFYGTVALKTDDRPKVVSALDEIVRRSEARFLVSPPIDGWISVYPDDSGQDEKVSRRIARRLGYDIVHLISHDEDVFLYFVYRQGKRVDQYSSDPGYFREVTQAIRRGLRGRPERFLDLFGGGSIESVREVLDPPERPVFSSWIMKRFAELLKIPHEMMTSYDDLMEGETEGIEGWDQFLHVPDRSAEVARRRKEEDEVRESRRRLLEERMLLVDRVTQRPAGVISHPVACPDRDGIGFLACPDAGLGSGTIEVERFSPPWSAGPSATGLLVESHLQDLVTSPSGRFLAIERGIAGWATAIWDRDSGQINEKASRVGGYQRVVFFPDESGWVGFGKNEVVVVPLDDRRESASWKVEGVSHGAIHPSGTILVAARSANKLLLLDLRSGRVVNELLMGGLSRTSGFVVMTRMFAGLSEKIREVMARFDTEAIQATTVKIRAERERRYAEGGIDDVLASSSDELKPFLQIRQELAGLVPPMFAQGELFPGAESANAFGFDDAGDWLFCATDKGVRAYPWSKIVTAVGETPAPSYSVTPDPYIEDDGHGPAVPQVEIDLIYDTRRSVCDLAYDSMRRRLLFSTVGGQVGFLDVDGGRQGIIVEPPGRPPMLRIHLSKDGSLLCCICNPDRLGRARAKHRAYLQIWDYVELCGLIDRSPG